ncbi:peptidyl-prolyl cis-trans isomerase [Blastococcus sp. SYSU DS0617]
MPRAPRVVAAGMLVALALPALAACRTSPDVAAYVGEETITVDELRDEVDARRDDPAVTAGEGADYNRLVLTELVRAAVFDSAAEHFGVDPDPDGLPELFQTLLGGQDPEAYLEEAGARGYSREDTLERVRQVALLQAIAVAEGEAEEPTAAALRATYEQGLAEQPRRVELGIITVPDQATADATVAELRADPESYAAVAAAYPGAGTTPAPQPAAIDQLAAQAPDLAARVEATPPGGVFATSVQGVSGVLVVVVGEPVVPSFEEVRPQLAAAALQETVAAGEEILAEYQDELDVDVNPRYGELEDGAVVAPEGGVVRLLGTED